MNLDKKKTYYIASPYTHPNKFVQQYRYEAVIYTASLLTKQGHTLIEPIGMCHEQSLRYDLPGGYEFWKTRDRLFIEKCDGIIVLQLPGWLDSVGVTDEIAWAEELGKDIHFLPPRCIWDDEVVRQLGA